MYQLKFTGQAEIAFPLDRNKDYLIAGEWSEVSRTEVEGNDEIITSYKLAPLRLATVDESGQKIRLKTKNANSVRIRAGIFRAQQERSPLFISQDAEEYYDSFTNKLLQPDNLQAVLNLLNL